MPHSGEYPFQMESYSVDQVMKVAILITMNSSIYRQRSPLSVFRKLRFPL